MFTVYKKNVNCNFVYNLQFYNTGGTTAGIVNCKTVFCCLFVNVTRAAGWSSPGPGPCSQPRGPGARGYEKPIFYRTVPVLSKREFAARSVIL